MPQHTDILQALDAFIRKYYKNLLLRGALYAVGIVGALFLAAVLLEHFGWLSTLGRALLFWGGLAAVTAVTGWFIARPLLKMQGLGRRLSHADAAKIIGKHFPEVSDKLLNLLQLQQEMTQHSEFNIQNSELLAAAVEQKTAELRPVPFLNAVDLKGNRRYLKYALPPLVVLAVLLLAAPSVVTEPSRRIANYSTVYERPAPFRFVVLNERLTAMQGDDFTLEVTTEGDARPAEVHLNIDGRRYRMQASSGSFTYTFKQLRRTQEFTLEGGGVASPRYSLEVLPNPAVVSFRMLLSYPAYTGRPAEAIENLGDASVPEGTTVRWLFQTQDADTLHFEIQNSEFNIQPDAGGRVELSRRVMQTMDYSFCASSTQNSKFKIQNSSDTLRYTLSAIADAVPMIVAEEMVDSLHPDRRLFRGRIKDDYGFSRLVFAHKVANPASGAPEAVSEAEMALGEGASQEFYFSFNTAELVLAPGDELSYWFEVYDNDAIHGPKKATSQVFEIKIPTADELDQLLDRSSQEVRQSAEVQMSELQKLQQEINDMMRRLVDKKELGWQDKKDLQQIAEKQRQVRQMMQQMQQQIQENNRLCSSRYRKTTA